MELRKSGTEDSKEILKMYEDDLFWKMHSLQK